MFDIRKTGIGFKKIEYHGRIRFLAKKEGKSGMNFIYTYHSGKMLSTALTPRVIRAGFAAVHREPR